MLSMHDVDATLVGELGELAVKRSQYIPQWFLDELRHERDASSAPAGEFHHAASVPVGLYEHWLRVDGFDAMKAPAREVLARLKRDGLDAFVATNKKI